MQDSGDFSIPNYGFNVYIFITAPIISIFLLVVTLKKRSKGEVSVNCWFCDFNLRVPRGNENCFVCLRCDQYNGFSQDGDYNKPIPAQGNEDLNYPVMGGPLCPGDPLPSWNNGLCSQCNHNQAVKIRLLASFQPILLSNEDAELSAYGAHLEHLYRLCWRCIEQVRTVLEKQDNDLAPLLPPRGHLPGNPLRVKTVWKWKLRGYLMLAVDFLTLCCSLLLLLHNLNLVLRLENIAGIVTMLSQKLGDPWNLCFIGFLSATGTSLFNVKQKDRKTTVCGIFLWTLLLSWLTYNGGTLSAAGGPYSLFLTRTSLLLCIALTLASLVNLFSGTASKHSEQRIHKRVIRKDDNKQDATETSSYTQDWIFSNNNQDSHRLNEDSASRKPKLTQAFGKMHITLENQQQLHPTEESLEHEFSYGYVNRGIPSKVPCGRPLVRPAQFLPPNTDCESVSQSSWVAGGFWASSASTVEHPIHSHARPTFGAFLTPPPSIDGSQNSQTEQPHLRTFLNAQALTSNNANTVRRRF